MLPGWIRSTWGPNTRTIQNNSGQSWRLQSQGSTQQGRSHCMQTSHSSCIIIVKNNKITGIFTERDIVTKIVSKNVDLKNEKICDYMTNDPEILQSDDSIAFALNKMTDGGFRHVPIVHSISKDLYVISMQDIINSIGDYYFADILNLPPNPVRSSSHREGA